MHKDATITQLKSRMDGLDGLHYAVVKRNQKMRELAAEQLVAALEEEMVKCVRSCLVSALQSIRDMNDVGKLRRGFVVSTGFQT